MQANLKIISKLVLLTEIASNKILNEQDKLELLKGNLKLNSGGLNEFLNNKASNNKLNKVKSISIAGKVINIDKLNKNESNLKQLMNTAISLKANAEDNLIENPALMNKVLPTTNNELIISNSPSNPNFITDYKDPSQSINNLQVNNPNNNIPEVRITKAPAYNDNISSNISKVNDTVSSANTTNNTLSNPPLLNKSNETKNEAILAALDDDSLFDMKGFLEKKVKNKEIKLNALKEFLIGKFLCLF